MSEEETPPVEGPEASAPAPAGDAPPPGGERLPTAEVDPGRRRLLHLATLGLGACAGAGLLGAVGTAALGTPLSARAAAGGWIDLGPLAQFPEGQALKVVAQGERIDGWNRFASRSLGGVVVVRRGESVQAFSSRCPHMGCDVFVAKEQLQCPCHESDFALDGSVIRGESPRGLDPLEVKVEDEQVLVRYQRFEVGTSERRPV